MDTLKVSFHLETFQYKAEILTLMETTSRMKTELDLAQNQLIDMIKQKLKYQLEAEAWQEDMGIMVAENIKLCHKSGKGLAFRWGYICMLLYEGPEMEL